MTNAEFIGYIYAIISERNGIFSGIIERFCKVVKHLECDERGKTEFMNESLDLVLCNESVEPTGESLLIKHWSHWIESVRQLTSSLNRLTMNCRLLCPVTLYFKVA